MIPMPWGRAYGGWWGGSPKPTPTRVIVPLADRNVAISPTASSASGDIFDNTGAVQVWTLS